MQHSTFGQILASLRKDLIDPETKKVWTQGQLAEAAGLSPRIIGAIERGEKINLDGEILPGLAGALQLTALEQREFYMAALETTSPVVSLLKASRPKQTLSTLKQLYLPAFVCDPFYTLVYANAQVLTFHGLHLETLQTAATQGQVNILHELFVADSDLRRALGQGWHAVAFANLQHFRVTSLRYRHTQRFQQLLASLFPLPGFTQLWQEALYPEEDISSRLRAFGYQHAVHKQVRYVVTTNAILAPTTELFLSVLGPSDKRTAEIFMRLGEDAPADFDNIQQFAGQ